MIFTLFIYSLVFLLVSIASILPSAILPSYALSLLATAIGTYNSFLDIFPFATLPTQLFLGVVLPFELALLIGKFFLGSRLPSNS